MCLYYSGIKVNNFPLLRILIISLKYMFFLNYVKSFYFCFVSLFNKVKKFLLSKSSFLYTNKFRLWNGNKTIICHCFHGYTYGQLQQLFCITAIPNGGNLNLRLACSNHSKYITHQGNNSHKFKEQNKFVNRLYY